MKKIKTIFTNESSVICTNSLSPEMNTVIGDIPDSKRQGNNQLSRNKHLKMHKTDAITCLLFSSSFFFFIIIQNKEM